MLDSTASDCPSIDIPHKSGPGRANASPGFANLIDSADVGQHVCLFRRDTHAVSLVNKTASWIFARAATGCGEDAIADDLAQSSDIAFAEAKRDVAQLLLSLRCEGLIPDQHYNCAVAARSVDAAENCPAAPSTTSWHATYALSGGAPVRLTCEDAALAVLLEAVLSPLQVDATSTNPAHEVAVSTHPDGLSVSRNGSVAASRLDCAAARRIALQAIALALHSQAHVGAILHASSVKHSGNCVVLAGATGSGKTTLMMGLVASGAGYLSDDFTLIDDTGVQCLPFPISASTKTGSWDLLQPAFPTLSQQAMHNLGPRQVRYTDPRFVAAGQTNSKVRCDQQTPSAISTLIFPTYSDGANRCITPISPETALSLLLQSGSEVVGEPRSIKPLAELANTVPAFAMTFGSLEDGVQGVKHITSSQATKP